MEKAKTSSCIYHDRIYPDGSEVQAYVLNIVCKDGEWLDPHEESNESKLSLEYIFH